MKGNFHVQFGIGGGESDLSADHTITTVKHVSWLVRGLNKSFITYAQWLLLPSIHGVFKVELLIVCFHILRNRVNVALIRRCGCQTLFFVHLLQCELRLPVRSA